MPTDFPLNRAYVRRRREAAARHSRNLAVTVAVVLFSWIAATGLVAFTAKAFGNVIEVQLDVKGAGQ